MTFEYLSNEWLAELARVGAELPEFDGADLVLQHEIAGAPAGKVRFHVVWQAGRLVEVAMGKHGDPDVQVVAKAPDALRVLHGDLTADAAFMQGRLKVDGDYPRFLDELRAFRTSEPYRAMWEHMAAQTAD